LNTEFEFNYNDLGKFEQLIVNGQPIQEKREYNRDGTIKKLVSIAEYTYRIDGMLENITYTDGSFIEYNYYKNGYLKKIKYSDDITKEFEYDHTGRIVKISEGQKSLIFKRDAKHRIYQEIIKPENEVQDCVYYKNGEIASINNIQYWRNEKGQLEDIILKDPNEAACFHMRYEYYPNGLLKKRFVDQGYFQKFSYDEDNRIDKIETNDIIYKISYDVNANIRTVEKRIGCCNRESSNYLYDSEDQLRFINSGSTQEIEYQYDERGNLKFEANTGTGITVNKIFNHLNQLESIEEINTEIGTLSSQLSYDSKGNLRTIDREDSQSNNLKIEFRYEGASRLKEIVVNQRIDEHFEYDSNDRIMKDSDNVINKNRNLKYAGIFPTGLKENDEDLIVIPDIENAHPLAFVKEQDIYIPTWILGSNPIIHDVEGNKKGEQKILPYGDKVESGISINPFWYKGYYNILGNGDGKDLHWAFSRFYSSNIKYFLSPDILHGVFYNPIGLNNRRIFLNNPLKYIDFLGLAEETPDPEQQEEEMDIEWTEEDIAELSKAIEEGMAEEMDIEWTEEDIAEVSEAIEEGMAEEMDIEWTGEDIAEVSEAIEAGMDIEWTKEELAEFYAMGFELEDVLINKVKVFNEKLSKVKKFLKVQYPEIVPKRELTIKLAHPIFFMYSKTNMAFTIPPLGIIYFNPAFYEYYTQPGGRSDGLAKTLTHEYLHHYPAFSKIFLPEAEHDWIYDIAGVVGKHYAQDPKKDRTKLSEEVLFFGPKYIPAIRKPSENLYGSKIHSIYDNCANWTRYDGSHMTITPFNYKHIDDLFK